MANQLVRLWESVGTGLILSWPSGIVYTNQAGGMRCGNPEIEGVFVPVGNESGLDHKLRSPENKLFEYFRSRVRSDIEHISDNDAQFIEQCLHDEFPLLRNIFVDRDRLKDSHQAWVHVFINNDPTRQPLLFEGFAPYPIRAVLTWTNAHRSA